MRDSTCCGSYTFGSSLLISILSYSLNLRSCFDSTETKTPRAFRLRANKLSVVPPGFVSKHALMGAFTPFPGNGGTHRRGLLFFQPNAPGRLLRPLHENSHRPFSLLAFTHRVLLPILAVPIFLLSIIYPFWIVKSQLNRKISFFSREIMRFSSLEI